MSFIYAEKNPIDKKCTEYSLNILSDTKTTLNGAVLANWSARQRKAIEDYGFIKSVTVCSGTLFFYKNGGGTMIRIIIGMIIGGCIGAFAMCLCIAAGKADENGY